MPHARLSPSDAPRWTACSGAVNFTEGMPSYGNEHSEWGTCAHWGMEKAFITHQSPLNFIEDTLFVMPDDVVQMSYDQISLMDVEPNIYVYREHFDPAFSKAGHLWTFTEEMAECASVGYEYALQKSADVNGKILAERKVNPGALIGRNDCNGTADITIVGPGYLGIFDLKAGRGVLVEPYQNLQLLLYLIGAFAELSPEELHNLETLEVGIIQPRIPHKDGPVRTWTLTVEELYLWISWFRATAAATDNSTDLTPGEKQCRWCLGKPTCPALKSKVVNALIQVPEGTPPAEIVQEAEKQVLREPEDYNTDELSAILEMIPMARDWMSAIESHCTEQALQGVAFAGHKVVRANTHQKWVDDNTTVINKLTRNLKLPKKDVCKPDTPISPGAARKLVGKIEGLTERRKKTFEAMITKPEGKPQLVPLADPRPALKLTKEQVFEGLPETIGENA